MPNLAKRYVLCGYLLLLLASLPISWLAMVQLGDLAYEEAQARARLVADEIADQVQLAVNVGIPVDRLVGVDELFMQRMESFEGLLSLSLIDAENRVLHERRAPLSEALPTVVMPIHLKGASIARVELVWRQPRLRRLVLPWALPLSLLVALAAGLAGEGLRYALTGLVLRRENLLRATCKRIAASDFATRPPRLGRLDFDQRLPWLTEQLRYVGEQHMRVERLAQSLRQTEPDFDKRHELDRVIEESVGKERFVPVATEAMPTSSLAAQQRWRGILLGVLAWSTALPMAAQHPGLISGSALALLLILLALAHRMSWWNGSRPAMGGALLGALVYGPGLAMILQLTWAPRQFLALGTFGYAALAAFGLAALFAPFLGSQTRERQTTSGEARHAA